MIFQETWWKKQVAKPKPRAKSNTAFDCSYLLNPKINLAKEIKNMSEKKM